MARRYATLYERLVANTKVDARGCWVWTGYARAGYPALAIRVPGRRTPKTIAAHRAMLEEFHDIVFPFDEAAHLCYNPMCINPNHLEVQTKAHNLGERRGYVPPANGKPWIPVLFPRSAWLEDLLEREGVAHDTEECPF